MVAFSQIFRGLVFKYETSESVRWNVVRCVCVCLCRVRGRARIVNFFSILRSEFGVFKNSNFWLKNMILWNVGKIRWLGLCVRICIDWRILLSCIFVRFLGGRLWSVGSRGSDEIAEKKILSIFRIFFKVFFAQQNHPGYSIFCVITGEIGWCYSDKTNLLVRRKLIPGDSDSVKSTSRLTPSSPNAPVHSNQYKLLGGPPVSLFPDRSYNNRLKTENNKQKVKGKTTK